MNFATMHAGTTVPDRGTFALLAAQRRVVPVTRRLLADGETPIGVYRKLAGGPGTFLLESAEPGRSWSRYSYVGVHSVAVLSSNNGRTKWIGDPPSALTDIDDPLEALRASIDYFTAEPLPDLPSFTSGLVGYLSYDVVRRFERLPDSNEDELDLPEIAMMLATDLVVLDHHDGSLLLVANAVLPENPDEATISAAYAHALGRLTMMSTGLATPTSASISTMEQPNSSEELFTRVTNRTPPGEYPKAVLAAKEAIKAGEGYQIVLSQRFQMSTVADTVDVYRVLRASNPSPYMYLLRFEGFDIVGSSPEALVKVSGRKATLSPIAGTRPRGNSPAHDAQLAAELLADPKERAEHVMLVDLARNDLGRVCEIGSIEVIDLMTIERYSHVMHIVSTVEGVLNPDMTGLDVVAATFPAGTLTGAPKIRAMQIIDELEPVRRGIYGGCVGYFDCAGDVNMAIAIRTAIIHNGQAYVQAGAGIVADSDPAAEDMECRNKATAVLSAIATAETLRPAS